MNMKKKKIIYPLFAVLVFLLTAIVIAQAAGTPGSSTDPLVTKSYVDQQIALLSSRIGSSGTSSGGGTVDNAAVGQLQTDVGDLTKFVIDALTDIENVKSRMTTLESRVATLESGFIVVQMNKGQKLMLNSGSFAILRSGQATAFKGESGTLVDVSSGADLLDGANIPVQHLVVTPKGDGRGMTIKSTTAYLVIMGKYTIQ